MIKSLYVHIPFCAHICSYCDFAKVIYDEKWAFSYVSELKREIDSYHIENKLDTIYIGGGTPTCLRRDLLDDLLKYVRGHLKEDGEFTIEGNPENIDENLVRILKNNGINRVSLGMESSLSKYLSLMGRKHSYEDVANAVKCLKKGGIDNISVDLIYALPEEGLEDLKKDVEALLSLDVPHLSAYSLTINDGTLFYNKGFKERDDETEANMYNLILDSLRKNDYERYEVSNFAKDGLYSRHNLTYWHDDEYYGVGLGASGYVNGVRYTNTKNLSKYLKGEYRQTEETLSKESQLEDFFLTNLRLAKGFKKDEFQSRFGFSFKEKYLMQFSKLNNSGLLLENEDSIYPSDEGMLLLDRILLELF